MYRSRILDLQEVRYRDQSPTQPRDNQVEMIPTGTHTVMGALPLPYTLFLNQMTPSMDHLIPFLQKLNHLNLHGDVYNINHILDSIVGYRY